MKIPAAIFLLFAAFINQGSSDNFSTPECNINGPTKLVPEYGFCGPDICIVKGSTKGRNTFPEYKTIYPSCYPGYHCQNSTCVQSDTPSDIDLTPDGIERIVYDLIDLTSPVL